VIFYYLLLFLLPFWQWSRLPSYGTWTTTKVAGALALTAALVTVFARRRSLFPSRLRPLWLLVAYFVLSCLLALLTGFSFAQDGLMFQVSALVLVCVSAVFVDTRERLSKSLVIITASMLVASVFVYSSRFRYGDLRPGGLFGDANYYSMAACATLPLVLAFTRTSKGMPRWLGLVTAASLIASVLLSASRSGFLSLLVVAAYYVLHQKRWFLTSAGLAGAVVLAVVLLPSTSIDRFFNPDYGTDLSTQARVELWTAAEGMIRDHPLIGVGQGQFRSRLNDYNPDLQRQQIAHNAYLGIAAESGLPMLLLFLAIFAVSWSSTRSIRRFYEREQDGFLREVALAIEIGLVSICISGMFISTETGRQTWLLVALTTVMIRLQTTDALSQPVE
jgi:O-antigen ligase